MHTHDKGNQRQRVMEQDTFLRLLLNCAVSAAVPQAYICASSDSAIFIPTLLESFLSAFTSPVVFLGRVCVFFFKRAVFNSALGECCALAHTCRHRLKKIFFLWNVVTTFILLAPE